MVRFLQYILLISGLLFSVSCKYLGSNKNAQIDHEIQVYHQAMKFGDIGTAIHATQSLLAWDTTKTNYYDTLAILYYHTNNYPQAVQAAQVILDKQPDNLKLMKVVANSYKDLERVDLAIHYFQKIEEKEPGAGIDYEIASCYFFANDFKSVTKYIDKILKDSTNDSVKVNITFNQGRDQQDVPVKAACYNLLGTMAMKVNMKDEAINNYKKALGFFPGFGLAKQNMDYAARGGKM